jgi:four helix bundle protein
MNMIYSSHKKLDVRQRSLVLAEHICQITATFPLQERYGLSAQMRRASVSVLSNLSEGAARRTRADYIHFLHIARGSIAERTRSLR